jgi:hypothetical protein
MTGRDTAPSTERPAGWVLAIRYGVPAAFILAGQVVLIITGDPVSWAGFTGAGVAILLIGLLVRIGSAGDRERDREQAARAYFAEHGRWPDEKPESTGRRWRLPENVATPESEAAERARRES